MVCKLVGNTYAYTALNMKINSDIFDKEWYWKRIYKGRELDPPTPESSEIFLMS